jgi:hypothetical protein
MPGPLVVPVALGIGQILGNQFGNMFGASKQVSAAKEAAKAQTDAANRAAELEYRSITDALDYQKSIDARDYNDWLVREARDRKDYEASELRKQPRRALADSAVRTLADYIRVPGMRPAQEVPVPIWQAPQTQMPMGPPTSTAMPVGGGRTLYDMTGQPMANDRFITPPRGRTLRDFTTYA